MKNKFSLIMATYGRKEEVVSFLKELQKINYDLDKIEVIIVDQNKDFDLSKIIKPYTNNLNIIYIKSDKKGLSINRNIGIKHATGDIIAFPDDDCEYLSDTLSCVNEIFEVDKDLSCVMGRIIERDGSDSLRKWPKENIDINRSNFYTKCSSVTMFYRSSNSKIGFDENLGAGQKYGSCEDTDILYSNIKVDKKVIYTPIVRIYHRHYDAKTNMSIDKIRSYSLGFGAFVKNNIDINTVYLMCKVLVYHLLKSIVYFIVFRFEDSKKSYNAFWWRLKGFFK